MNINATQEQIDLLKKIMGKSSKTGKNDKTWENLKDKLNELGPAINSVQAWKRHWREIKHIEKNNNHHQGKLDPNSKGANGLKSVGTNSVNSTIVNSLHYDESNETSSDSAIIEVKRGIKHYNLKHEKSSIIEEGEYTINSGINTVVQGQHGKMLAELEDELLLENNSIPNNNDEIIHDEIENDSGSDSTFFEIENNCIPDRNGNTTSSTEIQINSNDNNSVYLSNLNDLINNQNMEPCKFESKVLELLNKINEKLDSTLIQITQKNDTDHYIVQQEIILEDLKLKLLKEKNSIALKEINLASRKLQGRKQKS